MESQKNQSSKNIAQIIDELIAFEQNAKSIYEKFSDEKTKSIVTGMFQDLSSRIKELGAHLTGSGASENKNEAADKSVKADFKKDAKLPDVKAKASSNVDLRAGVEFNDDSDKPSKKMKNGKTKLPQSQVTRV